MTQVECVLLNHRYAQMLACMHACICTHEYAYACVSLFIHARWTFAHILIHYLLGQGEDHRIMKLISAVSCKFERSKVLLSRWNKQDESVRKIQSGLTNTYCIPLTRPFAHAYTHTHARTHKHTLHMHMRDYICTHIHTHTRTHHSLRSLSPVQVPT